MLNRPLRSAAGPVRSPTSKHAAHGPNTWRREDKLLLHYCYCDIREWETAVASTPQVFTEKTCADVSVWTNTLLTVWWWHHTSKWTDFTCSTAVIYTITQQFFLVLESNVPIQAQICVVQLWKFRHTHRSCSSILFSTLGCFDPQVIVTERGGKSLTILKALLQQITLAWRKPLKLGIHDKWSFLMILVSADNIMYVDILKQINLKSFPLVKLLHLHAALS